ncbi:MAG: TlpA family protein disulfide reductase, partial [Flavobacteriales bacterium]|nr:TlpA family protein disulfide reductase [Flavobacteriales bacterium]
FCLSFLLPITGHAQTVILGEAPGYEGSTISASSYHNYITSSKVEIAQSRVDLGGSFVMTLPDKHDQLVLIDLENLEFQLFATVGQRYVVKIDKFSLENDRAALKVVEAPKNDLNKLIPEFEDEYARLADSLYRFVIGSGQREMVDSIFDAFADSVKLGASPYFKTYVDYNIALIKQMTHKSKKAKFEMDYIANQPVKEDNIAYMSFINQYYANYLEQLSMIYGSEKVRDWINKKKNVTEVLNEMGKEKALANDTLRELILLKSLYEVYYNDAYKDQMVLDMIDSVAQKTKIQKHVELAENIKATVSQLRVGSEAPEFMLMDGDGKASSLSDFKGKFVYITFWATWSVPSLMEMKVMPSLVKKYGDNITFIHVSVDKSVEAMSKFLSDQGLIVPESLSKEYYLYYGAQKSIMSDYKLESVPHYVFVDKGGLIIRAPAERPSGEVQSMFNNVLLNKKEQPNISDPGND